MERSEIGRVLRRAVEDDYFRQRSLTNLGMALAEEGFVMSDADMHQLRNWWEELQALTPRRAYERIEALARSYRR